MTSRVRIAQWVAVVGGVALMAWPAIAGYVDTPAGEVHRTVGPLIATAGAIALSEVTSGVRWVNLVFAAALAGAPLVAGHPPDAAAIALATAAVVAATTPFGGTPSKHMGGGWRAAVTTTPDRAARGANQ